MPAMAQPARSRPPRHARLGQPRRATGGGTGPANRSPAAPLRGRTLDPPGRRAAADLASAPVAAMAEAAARGSEDFTVRPRLPLYLPGETVELEARWKGSSKATAEITVTSQAGAPLAHFRTSLPTRKTLKLRAPDAKGLYVVEARLLVDGQPRMIERNGFWMRDQEALRSGPKLSVDGDYFQLDGRPIAVVGTTYMASDVQRLFFEHPNPFVWDRDLRALAADGLNMLRTGWWTGWDGSRPAGTPHAAGAAHAGGLPDDGAPARAAGAVHLLRVPARRAGRRQRLPRSEGAGATGTLGRRRGTARSAKCPSSPGTSSTSPAPRSASGPIARPATRSSSRPGTTGSARSTTTARRWPRPGTSRRYAAEDHPAPHRRRLRSAGRLHGTRLARAARLPPLRAGNLRGLARAAAPRHPPRGAQPARHRRPGRGRFHGAPLARVLRSGDRLHHQPLLVAERCARSGIR